MMDSLAATVDSRSSRRKFSKPPVKLACLSWYAVTRSLFLDLVLRTNKSPNEAAHCEFAAMARIPAPIAPPKTKNPPAHTFPADAEARAIARTASAREYQHQSGLPSRIIPRIQRKGKVSHRRLNQVLDRRRGRRMQTGSISLWT